MTGDVVTSFVLAWEAILLWNVIAPMIEGVELIIRTSGQWSQVLGVLAIAGSYYFLLSITLPVAKKRFPRVNPILTAYLGGWWLVILLAFLSVQSAVFNDVLGMPMATQGASLIFITLGVGLAKYWLDGYRKPPKAPESLDETATKEDASGR
jgi:hypothetical protein